MNILNQNLKLIWWLFFALSPSFPLSLVDTVAFLQPLESKKGKESLRQSDLLRMEGGQGNSLTLLISTKFSLSSDKTLIWCSHRWLTGEMEWILSTVFVWGRSFDYRLTRLVMAVKLTLEEMSWREIWGEERSYVWLKRDDAHRTGLIKNSAPTSLQN